jgi:Na+/H+ antiporter NhaD/arsenite permease-like protein
MTIIGRQRHLDRRPANLTVAGIAERNSIPFRFLTYTYYAFLMMLVSVAICHVYVWCRYF